MIASPLQASRLDPSKCFEAALTFLNQSLFGLPQIGVGNKWGFRGVWPPFLEILETNLASRWEGVRLPPSFWDVPGLPRKFPELLRKFSATSPEVLSLWNLTAIQRFPGSFPNFPGSSPNFPGSSGTSPEVSPFLWEALTPSPDSQKLSLKISGNRPFSPFFALFQRVSRAPGKSRKREGKGLFSSVIFRFA